MFLLLILALAHEINKNFAHLDGPLREKLEAQNIINKDSPKEDEQLAWFGSYDRDNNLLLDGHEVMFGILHEDIDLESQGEFMDYSKSEFFDDSKALYEQVEHILDIFDQNGDGFISYTEYEIGMELN